MGSVNNSGTLVIEGAVKAIIYHNEGNGFTVFTLTLQEKNLAEQSAPSSQSSPSKKSKQSKQSEQAEQSEPSTQLTLSMGIKPLTCTAYLTSINIGDEYKLTGAFVNNPRYGMQFSVSYAEKCAPRTLEGIEKYLASGVIKGVGERTAKRIVRAFGEDTFDIIEEQPERLTQIRGITLKKAMLIAESFHAQAALRRTMLFLQEFGISPAYTMKIFKQYKENAVDIVKRNPYRLADDIDGIGFKTADSIAWRVGIERDDASRIAAGIRYCLWEAANKGHTYLPENVLITHACELLDVDRELIVVQLAHMQMNRLIHREMPQPLYIDETDEADKTNRYGELDEVAGTAGYDETGGTVGEIDGTHGIAATNSINETTAINEANIINETDKTNNFSPDEPPDIPWPEELTMGLSHKPPSPDSMPRVFLSAFYHAEMNVARKLSAIAYEAEQALAISGGGTRLRLETEQTVLALERETAVNLSEGQRKAVVSAVLCGVLVITGGPGTGKTTAINTIIELLSAKGLRIELAAPTGRAAKRMTEATGREAKTLHRLLETAFIAEDARRQTFQRNEDNPLDTDVLIVDEISMADILLMQSLLRAVVPGTRLILVGDVDQLPSVGPGNVLKDLIASQRLTVIRLTEIFRQAQESAIVMNAHRINRGEYPVLNDRNADFFFLRRTQVDEVTKLLTELVTQRLPRYLKGDKLTDIQILTPMRKSPLGVTNLNKILQAHINPPNPDKKEREFRTTIFREGDKVMQIKNNYSLSWKACDAAGRFVDEGEGVFNGDCGIIRCIDEENEIVTVRFDDNRQADYDFSHLEELELAYAVTIHKSQGSEYRAVVIPLLSGPPMLLSRNLLYTAVTRARELAVIVGLPETLYRMVDNNRELNRYTALARRIETMFDLQGINAADTLS